MTAHSHPSCATCKARMWVRNDASRITGRLYRNCKSCRDRSRRPYKNIGERELRSLSWEGHQRKTKNAYTNLERGQVNADDTSMNVDARRAILPQKPKTRECVACTDSFQIQEFPSLMECSHEPNICHGCFLAWLDERMASTSWEQIQCAFQGCGNPITHSDVKTYASAEVFERSART